MGSELVLQDLASFFITSPGLDDGAGASDDTTSLSFLVVLALTNPFSELELAFDFEERDSVVLAEGTDELLVGGFFTGSSEDAEVSGTLVKILDALVESTRDTINNGGGTEGTFQSQLDIDGRSISS